jgi:subtilase family serine protease
MQGGQHALSPEDFGIIYNVAPLWAKGIDGSGQSIAVVSRAEVNVYDINTFRSYFQLPAHSPIVIYNGPSPGTGDQGDVAEAELDAEWSGAVAKGADIKVIVSASTSTTDGIDLSSIYAVDNNVAPILSVSYGFCERSTAAVSHYSSLWRQAAAQGMSVLVASGDNGSAGCDDPAQTSATHGFAVSGMASSPDVVAVGGTQFDDVSTQTAYWGTNDAAHGSALSYIPETVWNESGSTGLWSGSGGVSTFYTTPSWQTGAGVPSSDPGNASGHHRYLPDLSLAAGLHDGYASCIQWNCNAVIGGTSASVTAFAGVMALVNQKMDDIQGNPNFRLYPLATIAGVYHDVTAGSNSVACSTGVGCSGGKLTGYAAGTGFDLATGLGSVDVDALVTHWADVTFQPTTVTGSASPTSFIHGSPANLSASVAASIGTPKGAIAAYVVNGAKTVELGAIDLASGTQFPATNKIPGGTSTLYFRYGGDGVHGSSTSSGVTLTVSPEPSTLTLRPPTSNPEWTSNWSVGVNVSGGSGVGIPSGNVDFSVNGATVGTATLDASGQATFNSGFLPSGPSTIKVTGVFRGDANFSTVTNTTDVTFTKATPNVVFTCFNSYKEVVAGTDIPCNGMVSAPFRASTLPTGTLQFVDGSTPAGNPVSLTSVAISNTWKGLAVGTHQLGAVYSGDSRFASAKASANINVVANGTVQPSLWVSNNLVVPGSPIRLTFSIDEQQYGPQLTGTATLYDGTTAIASYKQTTGSWNAFFTVNPPEKPLSLGTHNFSLVYSGDKVWHDATVNAVPVLVSNPDVLLTGVTPLTITKGTSRSAVLGFSIVGANQTGNISLGCSGAPAETTCSLTPNSVSVQSSPVIVLAVTTTAAHQVIAQQRYTAFTFAITLLPFGLVVAGPRGGWRRSALLIASLVILLSLASCGGGGKFSVTTPSGGGGATVMDPGTPMGTYTLTVTTTYGSGASAITHAYPFQVTVE